MTLGTLSVIFYVLVSLLIVIALLILFLLFIPIRYEFRGGYKDFFWVRFDIKSLPLIAVWGNWDSQGAGFSCIWFRVFGLSFSLNPEKWGKNEKKDAEEQEKKLPLITVLRGLDGELLGNGFALLRDLLRMLRPTNIEVRGLIGFPEPHLTGWFAILNYMVGDCCGNVKWDVVPFWQEEAYEFSCFIEGRVIISGLLCKLIRFLLTRRTREFIKMLRKERASIAI